ncbi:hypothetical protein NKDENANG_01662 [Candidatus Entotheonellaceae bacterium PAL068K]
MTPRLVRFIHLLRQHGVRISVAESLDALHSVSQLGLQDRQLLRLGLRTALVKSHQDFATFDALFERFFTVSRRRKRRRVQQPHSAGNGMGQRPTAQPNGIPARPISRPPLSTSAAIHRPHRAEPPATAPELASPDLAALTDLERAWQQQLVARPPRMAPVSHEAHANTANTRIDRAFPPDHLGAMYAEVERLAARLLTRRAWRFRRAHYGRFNLRRTVLQSLRSGREVPFNLIYRRRHLTKLRLIVLCDVSGSVWHVSTFLLKLVHTLQSEFTSVRSLVFVNSIVDVTSLFRRMRFPQDLEVLRQYPDLNLFGFSDFGRAFYQFYRDELDTLTRETVILILGDARNNALDPQAWTLGDMHQRCRRLIWLNPEPRRQWNSGDSVLDAYAPFCDHVLECWTLAHLVRAADLLLQP